MMFEPKRVTSPWARNAMRRGLKGSFEPKRVTSPWAWYFELSSEAARRGLSQSAMRRGLK